MKLIDKPDGTQERVSTGKLLEIIPVIEDPSGQPMMLPPAVWPVDGWVLGYTDAQHIVGTPWTCWFPGKAEIPGSRSAYGHRLSFVVRVMEDGEAPPRMGTIDKAAAMEICEAIRTSWKKEPR